MTMPRARDSAGEYPITARAKDEKGLISGWSNVHILTVKDSLK